MLVSLELVYVGLENQIQKKKVSIIVSGPQENHAGDRTVI
jgi:hypothetical protein